MLVLITERTFIPHLLYSAMLSLWKTDCVPCVAWKHMWDEIGDRYKKMGDNTVHGALKQKKKKKKAAREYVKKSKPRQVEGERFQMHQYTLCFSGGGGVQFKSNST